MTADSCWIPQQDAARARGCVVGHVLPVAAKNRTATPSAGAAHAAFWALYGAAYDPTHLLLMTRDNKQVTAYRYGSRAGEPDYIPPGATLPE
jgi:hypothetical protein